MATRTTTGAERSTGTGTEQDGGSDLTVDDEGLCVVFGAKVKGRGRAARPTPVPGAGRRANGSSHRFRAHATMCTQEKRDQDQNRGIALNEALFG